MKEISEKRKEKEIQDRIKSGFSLSFFKPIIKFFLKITFLEKRGIENAKSLQLVESQFSFKNLPKEFDNYKILFITDLHIDLKLPLDSTIHSYIKNLDYDIVILGGDYYRNREKNIPQVSKKIIKIIKDLTSKTQVFGVLGNNDEYDTGRFLEYNGVKILLNDNIEIKKKNSSIYLCGIDDSHFYKSDNLSVALTEIPENKFKILISHAPDIYKESSSKNIDLLLSGHTHGGQICLPGRIHLISQSKAPRKMVYGKWDYKNLQGFTSCGCGYCIHPVRFNCPPEIVLITLKKIDNGKVKVDN